ncbi:MAG: sigma-54-dependent Fis family transcriptional regulator [Planctomycetaceae bacterium]|nr:sigma-54-dependent Fis family transcriptional regulator [Planctomycetaceae bacterium]
MNSLPTQLTVTQERVAHVNHAVLILCANKKLRLEIAREIGSNHYLVYCESLVSLKRRLKSTAHRAVVVCITSRTLGDVSSDRFFSELKHAADKVPVYALLDSDCPPDASTLVRKHADLCLQMPVDYGVLDHWLTQEFDLSRELEQILTELPHKSLHGGQHSVKTFTPKMFKTLEEMEVAAQYDITILLNGETGTGKTHLAQLFHERSPRSGERFVTVSCGAIPPDLIESELFGYVKGAFTGADRDKEGKFSAAGKGTLLLDEIDVLPLDQQAKLLRVIETSEFEPVGSNETQFSQARLIVASNEELTDLVETGVFRSDLYYRLNVINFHLPPLRERPWDIEYMARKFAMDYSRAHNLCLRETEPAFIRALVSYSWPGNIRELKNVIHRAVLYCRRGTLAADNLPNYIRDSTEEFTPGEGSPRSLSEQMERLERRIIEGSLRRNKYSRKQTALELSIGRVTLYNKMKRFGLLD